MNIFVLKTQAWEYHHSLEMQNDVLMHRWSLNGQVVK